MKPPRRAPQSPSRSAADGRVRIIGGRWRGSRLPVPEVDGLRPTGDRVRETVFNWLQPVLPGARVLDLFAGTGAFGLEALSRGAAEALLVERDPRACESLRGTVQRLGAGDQAQVHRADALALLRAPLHGRFDIVFLDPPFAAGAWDAAIAALPPWLAGDAWLYLEAPRERLPATPAGWTQHREGAAGGTAFALYRRRGVAGPAADAATHC